MSHITEKGMGVSCDLTEKSENFRDYKCRCHQLTGTAVAFGDTINCDTLDCEITNCGTDCDADL